MNADILLIEDSHEDAELVTRIIKSTHPTTTVKIINDGAAALDFLIEAGASGSNAMLPKVVFLDIKLPKLTGLQILGKLRESGFSRTIPVVMMTSSNQQSDIEECYRLGANSYLVKPIEFPALQKMVVNSTKYWLNFNRTCSC